MQIEKQTKIQLFLKMEVEKRENWPILSFQERSNMLEDSVKLDNLKKLFAILKKVRTFAPAF